MTGTFRHSAAIVIDLYVTCDDQPIGTTASHPFWSETRQDFLQAGTLQLGEELRTETGASAHVRELMLSSQSAEVFNLAIDVAKSMRLHQGSILTENNQVMGSVLLIFHWAGMTIVTTCCVIVAMKCVWNFGLPYAMLRITETRGWSFFPLIEFIPLTFAILMAWATHLSGWLSPKSIAVGGVLLIASSYIHLLVVLMFAGWMRPKRHTQPHSGIER